MNQFDVEVLFTYGWVIALAALGGLVGFIRRLNASTAPKPLSIIFLKLGGELIISAFAGLITYWLCQYWQLSSPLQAIAIAISGHMGGRAIDGISRMWLAFLETKGTI